MGQFGAGIKSVQQGAETITSTVANPETVTNNVTIDAIVMAKSIVMINFTHATTGEIGPAMAYLTSTTNLRIQCRIIGAVANQLTIVGWQVIEYY